MVRVAGERGWKMFGLQAGPVKRARRRIGLPHLESDAVAAGVKELVQLGTGTLDGGLIARDSDDADSGVCSSTCEGCEEGPEEK